MGEVILVESLDGLSPTSTTLKRTFTKNKKKIKKEKKEKERVCVFYSLRRPNRSIRYASEGSSGGNVTFHVPLSILFTVPCLGIYHSLP